MDKSKESIEALVISIIRESPDEIRKNARGEIISHISPSTLCRIIDKKHPKLLNIFDIRTVLSRFYRSQYFDKYFDFIDGKIYAKTNLQEFTVEKIAADLRVRKDKAADQMSILEATDVVSNKVIVVDFARHPDLYDRVLKQADEDIRNPSDEILFWIKNIRSSAM